MKKVLLIAICFLAISLNAKPRDIKVIKNGRGFWGYDWITEVHTGNYSQLNCQGKGHEKCRFSALPTGTNTIDVNNRLDLIDDDIIANPNEVSGVIKWNNGDWATWKEVDGNIEILLHIE